MVAAMVAGNAWQRFPKQLAVDRTWQDLSLDPEEWGLHPWQVNPWREWVQMPCQLPLAWVLLLPASPLFSSSPCSFSLYAASCLPSLTLWSTCVSFFSWNPVQLQVLG